MLSPIFFGQQNFTISSNYLLFEDALSGEPILVYSDSMAVRGLDFKTHFKIKFPENLSIFEFNNYQYQIDGVNYLVDDGCGPVVKFEKNIFTRIDNSFKHKNQYFGIPFLYNKTIYLWGGYGLFTFKNILTYYDFSGNEWLEKSQFLANSIEPRSNSFSLKKNSDLYIFCGITKNGLIAIEHDIVKENYVYRLDLNDFSWHKEGKHITNLSLIRNKKNINLTFQIDNKIVDITDNIKEIDIFGNTIKTYGFKNFKELKNIIYHKISKSVTYVYSSDYVNYVMNEPYTEFRGKLIEETKFYEDSTLTFLFRILILLIILILIFIIVRFLVLKIRIKKFQIKYYKRSDKLCFKKNEVQLGILSFAVLKVFIEKQHHFFPLNNLNDILSKDLNKENYITINKRRERVLKELTLELSSVLNIPKETVFTTRSSEFDKRIKEIKLNLKIEVID